LFGVLSGDVVTELISSKLLRLCGEYNVAAYGDLVYKQVAGGGGDTPISLINYSSL